MKMRPSYMDCSRIITYLSEKIEKDEKHRPLAIAVSDGAGNLISLTLTENMSVRGGGFATHKAYTAAKFQKSTMKMVEHLDRQGVDMSAFCDPNLSPLKGGAPIITAEGDVIGAVGISGWAGWEDQELADEAADLVR